MKYNGGTWLQMKTAVITGSSRGLGFEMAKCFRKCGMNVVLNGVSLDRLQKARHALESIPGNGKVLACSGDVCNDADLQSLIDKTVEEFGAIDIWINNAGVNQPMKPLWELSNTKNNIHIQWLTPRKVMWRFMTAGFNKRDFFA